MWGIFSITWKMDKTSILCALTSILTLKPKRELMLLIETRRNGARWLLKVLLIQGSSQVIELSKSIAQTFGRLNLAAFLNQLLMRTQESEASLI